MVVVMMVVVGSGDCDDGGGILLQPVKGVQGGFYGHYSKPLARGHIFYFQTLVSIPLCL